MPLINCEVSLTLTLSENYVLTSKATRDASPGVNAINKSIVATFKIKETKSHVPVVTLSAQHDNKLLEQLKTGFIEQLNGINIDQKCLIRLKII